MNHSTVQCDLLVYLKFWAYWIFWVLSGISLHIWKEISFPRAFPLSRTHKVSSLRTTSYLEIVARGEVLETIFHHNQRGLFDVDVQAKVFYDTLYLLLFVMIVVVIAVIIRECGRCGSWGKRVLADTFWLTPATLYSIQHCSASPIVDNWWSSWSSLLPVIITNMNHCYQ